MFHGKKKTNTKRKKAPLFPVLLSHSGSSCLARRGVAAELLLVPTHRPEGPEHTTSALTLCSDHVDPQPPFASLSVPSKRAFTMPEFRVHMGTDYFGKRLQWECLNRKKTCPSEHIRVCRAGQRNEPHLRRPGILQNSIIHRLFSTASSAFTGVLQGPGPLFSRLPLHYAIS